MSIKMSRNSPSPVKGASALGKTRGPPYKVNETEQSFQNIEEDEI